VLNLQQLQVNLIVQVPDNYILVEKVEFEKLQQEQLSGRYWTMDELECRTGRGHLWLKNNLLYIPKFKKQLEKFVHYPNASGEKWAFQASKMSQFLEDNFYSIFKG